MPVEPHIEILADAESLAARVAAELGDRIATIQADRTPTLVLTGGTVAKVVYGQLSADSADWTDVDYFWGDERWVPAGHADRNDREAHEAFLDRFSVPDARVHAMPADDGSRSLEEAAADYARVLPAGRPFDITLLGMGPDAHIASLFPGHPQLSITDRPTAAVEDSPKPPPRRITLTYPVINASDAVWFIVSGAGKAEAVRAALAGETQAPAGAASGTGETVWWLDRDAASLLR